MTETMKARIDKFTEAARPLAAQDDPARLDERVNMPGKHKPVEKDGG